MQRRENLEKVRIKWGPRPEESMRRWGRHGEDGEGIKRREEKLERLGKEKWMFDVWGKR